MHRHREQPVKCSTQSRLLVWSTSCLILGCANDGSGATGSLEVLLEAESTVREGIQAGSGSEDVADGWSVQWDNYIVSVGGTHVAFATDAELEVHDEQRFVVDLVKTPSAGVALWSFPSLAAGRWNVFYELGGAGDTETTRDASVSENDYDRMVQNDLTYLIRGALVSEAGQSCPPANKAQSGDHVPNGNVNARGEPCYAAPRVELEIAIEAEAIYGPCTVDEVPGIAIPSGGSQTAALTLHGDHLFFNGFPEGAEGGVTRRAQWWADADLNLDGKVEQAELQALNASDLAEFDEGYQLGGAPNGALDSLWTYVAAQLRTQGHFQGEGECPVDGVEHDH